MPARPIQGIRGDNGAMSIERRISELERNGRQSPSRLATFQRRVSVDVVQTSHGFSVMSVVRKSGSVWALASIADSANKVAIGVVESVVNADNFTVVFSGLIRVPYDTLVAGSRYWLSQSTSGLLTTTTPTDVDEDMRLILYAMSDTTGTVCGPVGADHKHHLDDLIGYDPDYELPFPAPVAAASVVLQRYGTTYFLQYLKAENLHDVNITGRVDGQTLVWNAASSQYMHVAAAAAPTAQAANLVYAGPATGASAIPTFRALGALDLAASPAAGKLLLATSATAQGWFVMGGDCTIDATGVVAIAAGAIVDADVNASAAIAWTKLNKSGSSLADLTTKSAADLSSGTLAAARMPALTGDITAAVGTTATTLASVGTAGTTGSASVVPVITTDAKGRVTAVTSATITPASIGAADLAHTHSLVGDVGGTTAATVIGSGKVLTAMIGANQVTAAKLAQSAGYTVVGNPGTTLADPTGLTASTAGTVLARSAAGWGFIDDVELGTTGSGGGSFKVFFAAGKYVEISTTGVVTIFQSSTAQVVVDANAKVTITYPSSNTVEINSADFVGSSKAVKLREIDVCDAGVAKKMLMLCSAAY